MYDHFTVPDVPGTSRPLPRWVKIVLFGPFLAVMLSTVLLQFTESQPSLNGAARVSFLIGLACLAMGFASVFGACIFRLLKRGGSRRVR